MRRPATKATLLLDVLTPIAKSWPSQWCLEANSLAIQVHGGYGYTRDYDVEQYYRDNRLNPIHEGTHGIQGLDLLGRKVTMQDGAGLKLLDRRSRRPSQRAQVDRQRRRALRDELASIWSRIVDMTAAFGNQVTPLLHSRIRQSIWKPSGTPSSHGCGWSKLIAAEWSER